jgi:hypothetical protein
MSDEIKETVISMEKDISIARTVTMPILLFRLCKKYRVSVSDATREGALMLLRMNERFMDCEENLEDSYKNANSKYKDKVRVFTSTIEKITGSK